MLELLEQQKLLKRQKFWWHAAFYSHFVTLGLCFGGVAFLENPHYIFVRYMALVMILAVVYVVVFGFCWIIPIIQDRMWTLEKELTSVSAQIFEKKAINQQLDELQDQLIFDEDEEYWTILEKLEKADA